MKGIRAAVIDRGGPFVDHPVGRDLRTSDRAVAEGAGGERWREISNRRVRCRRNIARRGWHDAAM
jgi:hypothetical protein